MKVWDVVEENEFRFAPFPANVLNFKVGQYWQIMHRCKAHSLLSKSYKRSKCPRCDVAGHEARQVWVQKNIKFDPFIDIFSVKMTVFWILFFSDALRRDRNTFPNQLFACSWMVWFIKTQVDENNLQDSSKLSLF